MDNIQEAKNRVEGFVKISRYAGMREDLVQAGGGNSAVKLSGNRMLIKASGYQLSEVSEKSGYSVVDPSVLRGFFARKKELNNKLFSDNVEKELLDKALLEGGKPSIETFLHSFSGTYTLHTHPVVVNAFTCRKKWVEELQSEFQDALFVPYEKPGIELAMSYYSAARSFSGADGVFPDCVFLKNHGLLVSGDTPDEVINKTEKIIIKLEKKLGFNNEGYHRATTLWRYFPDKIVWKVTDVNVLNVYRKLGKLWNTSQCPDCVVYLGKLPLSLEMPIVNDMIDDFTKNKCEPVVVEYMDDLFIMADSVRKALETQSVLSFSAQVEWLNHGTDCDHLSEEEQNVLLNWDSEKYRKALK